MLDFCKMKGEIYMKKLNTENFKDETKEGKVIVDFWAEWCGPCKQLGPIFKDLSEEIEGVTFAKVNVDEQGEVAQEFKVRGIPTMVLFENGKEVDRIVGFVPKESLKQKIEKAFA